MGEFFFPSKQRCFWPSFHWVVVWMKREACTIYGKILKHSSKSSGSHPINSVINSHTTIPFNLVFVELWIRMSSLNSPLLSIYTTKISLLSGKRQRCPLMHAHFSHSCSLSSLSPERFVLLVVNKTLLPHMWERWVIFSFRLQACANVSIDLLVRWRFSNVSIVYITVVLSCLYYLNAAGENRTDAAIKDLKWEKNNATLLSLYHVLITHIICTLFSINSRCFYSSFKITFDNDCVNKIVYNFAALCIKSAEK